MLIVSENESAFWDVEFVDSAIRSVGFAFRSASFMVPGKSCDDGCQFVDGLFDRIEFLILTSLKRAVYPVWSESSAGALRQENTASIHVERGGISAQSRVMRGEITANWAENTRPIAEF